MRFLAIACLAVLAMAGCEKKQETPATAGESGKSASARAPAQPGESAAEPKEPAAEPSRAQANASVELRVLGMT